jgi:CRP-like cAMP-binding protein
MRPISPPIEVLGQLPVFQDLNEAELADVGRRASLRRVEKDAFFFFQEDPADAMYVVQDGRVKLIQLSPEGQQIILNVIGPGQLLAVIAMVPGVTYPISAQAATNAAAWKWSHETLIDFMERHPRLALNAMRIMGQHLRDYQDRIRELTLERVERRLARALLRLATQVGRKIEEGVLIDLPISRQELAEISGTTLYTVSRILSEWERQELIDTGRERVLIRFPHGLVRIAEDLPSG